MIIRHVLACIAVLVSMLVLPSFLYIPVLFLAIILIPFFWEGIIFGALIDVAYGSGYGDLSSLVFSFAFATFLALVLILPIRDRIRVNA